MFNYKVLESNEDPNQVILEKSGDTVKFTAQEVKDNLMFAYKQKRELESMWRIAEATKINIERTHPQVKELGDELLTAAFLYREQIGVANETSRKLQEVMEAISTDEQALIDASEQTGLDLAFKFSEPAAPVASEPASETEPETTLASPDTEAPEQPSVDSDQEAPGTEKSDEPASEVPSAE